MLLVGFTDSDTDKEIDYMVDKIINLRIFDDENGVMNKSLINVNGSILSISQFTLYADTRKGRRPSYIKALNGDKAILLYDKFNNKLKEENIKVETGIFGADMKVSLINDGPITIMLEK
jgi:D-aminoacyl-tRNA deacylase